MSTETWNKLSGQNISTEDGHMGVKYWDGTVDALKSVGHRVFAPTLSDEFSSNLTDHINQIYMLIVEKDLQNIILVGHSYGGFVITGVADQMPERIHLLVYLDSGIPDPGQSLVDALNMVYSKEDYAAAVPDPKSEFIDVTRIAKEKVDASIGEWTYFELPSSHVPMADLPEEFYKLMLEIAKL